MLSDHIAEEQQLLAEEKWIIEALSKIKAQKNSLQIERLNLESLKAQVKNEKNVESQGPRIEGEPAPLACCLLPGGGVERLELLPPPWDSEEHCNQQQLDLTVTTPVFSKQIEDMSEEDEEEEDGEEDVLLDINMLMAASQST